jgi:hypothetical protein
MGRWHLQPTIASSVEGMSRPQQSRMWTPIISLATINVARSTSRADRRRKCPDPPHAVALLRTRSEWSRHRRVAEKRNEIAPP